MKDRIARIIQEYDSQGIHRTGTEVDAASADWLAANMTELGATPVLDEFGLNRVDVQSATLTLGDNVIGGVPAYDCNYTDASGVSGAVGELGSNAPIGIIMALPFDGSPEQQAVLKARKENTHQVIVVVTDERMPPDGPAPVNAEHFSDPFGSPVLQIGNRFWSKIRSAIEKGESATAVVHAERIPATAFNVGATVAGKDPRLAPVVVMTPRSGWWTCASERGGGIATFLEILRSVTESQPDRTFVFTANSGHELGHIGLDHYLDTNLSLIQDAHIWIHLGANFAASVTQGVRLQYSDDTIEQQFNAILSDLDLTADQTVKAGTRPVGEARNIFDGSGRYVSIVGGNALFHHPADRFPDAVNIDIASGWATAFVQLATELAKT